jgi:hypothetical protein
MSPTTVLPNGVIANGIFYSGVHEPRKMPETPLHFHAVAHFYTLLRVHYAHEPYTGVFGDVVWYYEEGNKKAKLAPDLMVIHSLHRRPDTYTSLLQWQEDEAPCFILEAASESTKHNDFLSKRLLYEQMGVTEYAIFDPWWSGPPAEALKLYRLIPKEDPTAPPGLYGIEDSYELLQPEGGRYFSTALRLWLEPTAGDIDLYLPDGTYLPNLQEWQDKHREMDQQLTQTRTQLTQTRTQLTQTQKQLSAEAKKRSDAEALATAEANKRSDAEALLTDEAKKRSDAEALANAAEKKRLDAETLATAEAKKRSDAEALATAEAKKRSDAEALANAAEKKRQDAEALLADEAKKRLDAETQMTKLRALLRAQGIDPEQI